jgi:uncharacterized protein YbgA (DUF1722 family)/uncharacterized protein YbbK (DUF523 family)
MKTAPKPYAADDPVRIGVSACLLGREVRYDGGHKRDNFLVDVLGPFVEFVPVCPEFEAGLGVPRESLRLERTGVSIHMIGNKSRADRTSMMERFAARRTAALASDDLCGYVLKKDSPSCGLERVRVYGPSGMPSRDGVGLYAAALIERYPNLPIEEEGRLNDPRLRENFIERIFAYRRLLSFFKTRWTIGGLVELHTAHKLVLMAHSPHAYSQLGRLVAGAKKMSRPEIPVRYVSETMAALRKIATPASHVNVLQHIIGYLREHLDAAARAELGDLIDDYRGGLVPLIVPLTLIRHYVRQFDIVYLRAQIYLEPHPKELMLRNHV